jgi:hypothetical protein
MGSATEFESFSLDIGDSQMSQTLMDHYQDYAGLAPHETLLAREFHMLIVKQRISELQSQLDTLSKDENVHALTQQFNKSEMHFKLFNLVLLPFCIIVMLYLGSLF